MHKWQLHEAKNKLSSLIEAAIQDCEPQYITKRGEDAVVVIGIKEYQRLKRKTELNEFLLNGPKFDNPEIERMEGKVRVL